MNDWRSRLAVAMLFYFSAKAHDFLMLGCPNIPEAMLIYHGSAGAVDLMLLYCAPFFISRRLCDDIQATCIASIVVNFAGFCAYMAYAPPSMYNTLITGINYVQFLRLLFVGRYDADHNERSILPGAHCVRT